MPAAAGFGSRGGSLQLLLLRVRRVGREARIVVKEAKGLALSHGQTIVPLNESKAIQSILLLQLR
jgi:hypothetical protein